MIKSRNIKYELNENFNALVVGSRIKCFSTDYEIAMDGEGMNYELIQLSGKPHTVTSKPTIRELIMSWFGSIAGDSVLYNGRSIFSKKKVYKPTKLFSRLDVGSIITLNDAKYTIQLDSGSYVLCRVTDYNKAEPLDKHPTIMNLLRLYFKKNDLTQLKLFGEPIFEEALNQEDDIIPLEELVHTTHGPSLPILSNTTNSNYSMISAATVMSCGADQFAILHDGGKYKIWRRSYSNYFAEQNEYDSIDEAIRKHFKDKASSLQIGGKFINPPVNGTKFELGMMLMRGSNTTCRVIMNSDSELELMDIETFKCYPLPYAFLEEHNAKLAPKLHFVGTPADIEDIKV